MKLRSGLLDRVLRRTPPLVVTGALWLFLTAAAPPDGLTPEDVHVDEVGGVWQEHVFSQPPTPSRRMTHSLVHDPVRNRLISFGGWTGNSFLGDTWVAALEGPFQWLPLPTAGTAPSSRRGHSAVYDPVRDRMLVFGGVRGLNDSQLLNEVWELSLTDPPTWQQIFPEGTPPSPRFINAYAYDPVADRLIVVGGYDGGFRNDTWALSLSGVPSWSQLSPAGTPPVGRDDLPSAYDPVRHRLILFGGFDGSTILNDVWALSLAGETAWEELQPAGPLPAARRTSSLIYEPAGDRLILFAGWNGGPGYQDVWQLTLAGTPAWTELTAAVPLPARRWGHAAALDPIGNRLIAFAGGDHGEIFSDSWSLSLGPSPQWTNLPANPPASPSSRRAHAAVYDPVGHQIVVFGGVRGFSDSQRLNDVWVFRLQDPVGWQPLIAAGTPPTPRFIPAAAYDAARGRMLIFGGYDGEFQNDAWALELGDEPAWTQLTAEGEAPSGRDDLHGIYDPVHDSFVIYGGFDGTSLVNDVWALSLGASPTWRRIEPKGGGPAARRTHSVTYDPIRERMIVFGGWDGGDGFNDVWGLSLDDRPVWKPIRLGGEGPEPRWGHTAAYDPQRDRLLVMGGVSTTAWLNDVWSLSLGRPTAWAQLEPAGPLPAHRLTHSGTYDPGGQQLVVFGGYFGSTYLGDTWTLSFLESADGVPLPAGGEADLPGPSRIGAWPQPLTGSANLRVTFSLPPEVRERESVLVHVGLYDVRGRKLGTLHRGEVPAAYGRATWTWSRTARTSMDLATGVYFLRVTRPDGALWHQGRIVILD